MAPYRPGPDQRPMTMPPTIFVALFATVVVIAMVLLGVQLKLRYVGQVVRQPRALVVGLVGQLLLLPAIAAAFFYAYPAPPSIKAGAFIMAAVPGGVVSNMATFWGRGRLPLSIVLTACSTVVGVVTIPLWANVGLAALGDASVAELGAAQLAARSFMILVVPLAVGITIGGWKPELAQRIEGPTRRAMFVLLAGVVGLYLAVRWRFILAAFSPAVLVGALLFNAGAVLGGWSLAHGARLDRAQSFTVGIEVGVQNITMALLVVELIDRPELLPFVGYYALISLVLIPLWVRVLAGMGPEGRLDRTGQLHGQGS